MNNRKLNKGFTAIELIVVVALVALLATVGLSSMGQLVQRNRVTATTNDLLTALMQARVEALKLRQTVVICGSANANAAAPDCNGNWEQGWIIFASTNGDAVRDAGEQVLVVHPAAPNGVKIKDSIASDEIIYQGDGFPKSFSNTTISICGNNSATSSLVSQITIAPLGRATVSRTPFSGGATVDCS